MALSGSGTQEDPWLIQSLGDFDDFASDANYWDDYTRLETDVNLAGRVYERAVIAWDVNEDIYFQGTAFTGVFDGNNHRVEDLTIYGDSYVGLFGSINDGEIGNLCLEGGSVSGHFEVGGLIGFNRNGIISNCYSTLDVSGTGNLVGGLVGKNWGSISNCYSFGDVSGDGFYVGGLVGENSGSISNCYVSGYISGNHEVGGLAGNNRHVVLNCYSTGDVNGVGDVGGLVGWNDDGTISNCYSSSDVGGNRHYMGGLVGVNEYGSVSNCFWDSDNQTHGVTESIGGNEGTATNVHGLPTSQLQQQSTFTDWDFINVWNIGENQTYPYLRTVPAGDINKDKTVNFLDVCIIAEQWCTEE